MAPRGWEELPLVPFFPEILVLLDDLPRDESVVPLLPPTAFPGGFEAAELPGLAGSVLVPAEELELCPVLCDEVLPLFCELD